MRSRRCCSSRWRAPSAVHAGAVGSWRGAGDDFDVEELEGTQNGGMIEMDQPEPEARETMPEESAEPEDQDEMPADELDHVMAAVGR